MSGLVVELRLRRAEAPLDVPAAWFLPGSDPRAWLGELARWGRPLLGSKCYVVTADAEGAPAGLFVLALTPDAGPPSPRALPYRCLGSRLYVPVDAELDPRPSRSELESYPGDPLVVHPALGWVGFEPGDVIGPAELLAPPPRRDGTWDQARPGPAPLPTLRGVAAAQPPSLERVFETARREIGVERPDRTRPPGEQPEPAESPTEGSGEQGQEQGPEGVGGWLQRQTDAVRAWWRGEGGEGGEGGEADPAQGPAAPPDPEQVRKDRHQELRRLAQLLAEDPDRGLRRALPLAPEGRQSRTPPGVDAGRRLPERDLTLNLGERRGSGRRSAWEVSPELHLLLMQRYREAANRELSLGRHERAAYVFLELLGDARAAAKALEQGRRYREAALLYQERLQQPLEAASCLERGGLFEQAARLFAECGEDEQAARLYRRLGLEAEAERHFRRAASELERRGDLLGVARLLERELNVADEALEVLARAWPQHRQAGTCLRELLALQGRLGRHEAADKLVRELIEVPAPPQRVVVLVEALERTACTYPAAAVAARARDGVRAVAGARLAQAARPEAEQLLRTVARTQPGDPLLGRDVGRYVARLRGGSRRRVPPPLRRTELETVDRIQLPRDVSWKVVVPAGRGFYAAGRADQGAVAVRGRWDGLYQVVRWDGSTFAGRGELLSGMLLAPAASPNCPTVLVPVGHEERGGKPPLHLTGRLPLRHFPADDAFVEGGRIGTPGWIPPSCMAVATSPVGVVWAVHGNKHALVLSSLDAMQSGAVLSTRLVANSREAGQSPGVHLLALRDRFFLALGQRLEWHEQDQVLRTLQLDAEATGLVASPRHPCLVVTHADGATAFFSRGGGFERLPVGRDLSRPVAAFTREGLLALFGEHEVRCYEIRGQQLLHRGSFPWRGLPLALAPTHSHRFMAVFDAGGLVRVVELPSL